MTKEDNEELKNSTKCWICDNGYIDNDVNPNKAGLFEGSFFWRGASLTRPLTLAVLWLK